MVTFIRNDSPQAATALGERVLAASRSLSLLPERGRYVPEYPELFIRELFIRNYRLIYDIVGDEVRILGLVHGARDLLHISLSERLEE